MLFPRYVYKAKGPFERAGGTYDGLLVKNQDEMGNALANGWFAGLDEAIDGPVVPAVAVDSVPVVGDEDDHLALLEADDSAPPTREEIEAKARELGIKFDKRNSDKGLLAMIEQMLEP